LKYRAEQSHKPVLKSNQVDFHDAVRKNDITVLNLSGKGFGKDAVTIQIQSNSMSALDIVLSRGTVFQHTDWVYKQNLCVSSNTLM